MVVPVDVHVESALLGANLVRSAVEEMEAKPEAEDNHCERTHGDAQAAQRGAQVGKGPGGEIDGYAHGSGHPRKSAGHAGKTDGPGRCSGAGGGRRRNFDHVQTGFGNGAGEVRGGNGAGIVKTARGRLQLVFKPGGGHGDAALHFIQTRAIIGRQLDGAVEQEIVCPR